MTERKLRLSTLIDEGYAVKPANRWPTYEGGYLDRTDYVSASEVGGCARKIKLGKMLPSGEFTAWGAAERGNVIEAWAVTLIRAALRDRPEWTLLYFIIYSHTRMKLKHSM